jgi:uncharacterized protein YgbK (DUF1537 family)
MKAIWITVCTSKADKQPEAQLDDVQAFEDMQGAIARAVEHVEQSGGEVRSPMTGTWVGRDASDQIEYRAVVQPSVLRRKKE